MAKRKRLILPDVAGKTGSDMAQNAALAAKPVLRPGLGGGGAPIARVVADSASQAALAELSDAMTRARSEGRLVEALPLGAIEVNHLVRDRIVSDEEELGHLIDSIRSHGQRAPIEVSDLGNGRFGLISGWRRIQALTRLSETENNPRFGTVLALLRQPEGAGDAYIAMVEENEIRQGLSYYERARIAALAVDLGVFETEKQALQRLFAAASRARRSKIGSFLTLYRGLDTALRFPAAIPERLGLALAKRLEADPGAAATLCADLLANPANNANEELVRLTRFVSGKKGSDTAQKDPEPAQTELRPGVFLAVTGGYLRPTLTLTGPGVDPGFRAALEGWLEKGG